MKTLARQAVISADNTLKGKEFNFSDFSGVVNKEKATGSALSKKTSDYLASINSSKDNGTGKFIINKGQQNKHLLGTNEYKIASEAGLNKSILTVSPNSLLPELGNGQPVGTIPVGAPGSKERINYWLLY